MRYMDAYPGVGACPRHYGNIIMLTYRSILILNFFHPTINAVAGTSVCCVISNDVDACSSQMYTSMQLLRHSSKTLVDTARATTVQPKPVNRMVVRH